MAAPYIYYDPPVPHVYGTYVPYGYDGRQFDNYTPSYDSEFDDDDSYSSNGDATTSHSARSAATSDPGVDAPSKGAPTHGPNGEALPKLKIRRHTPGSNDPALQNFPINLETAANPPSLPPSNIKVTIARHQAEPQQPAIQPVPYPVPVYLNPPIPQHPVHPPFPYMQPAQPLQSFQPIQPVQSFQRIQPVQYVQPIHPVQYVQPIRPSVPVIEIVKPPSPKKPTTPVKSPFNPASSADEFITESFQLPASRNKRSNVSARKPLRTELIMPGQSIIKQRKAVPAEYLNEEYEEYYELPNSYDVSEKTVSYRPAARLTTRELENDQVGDRGDGVYLRPPKKQTITYRKS
ncbi:unnamed protein product [Rotaria socialis]|uniref:Uncharacterized protein n=1 Tax=Rotaria socialis TaxID=392032 RepID=A0A820SLC4_9BILA|nr:unnamed protein product [Rotaria socialis]CAF3453459.1 unnamed protein product [Rotaria socialis]CAF4165521.1 unnamed protein product [Rotaria socialis]CAF4454848.1 unnamed protein product [Rotaria socialis]